MSIGSMWLSYRTTRYASAGKKNSRAPRMGVEHVSQEFHEGWSIDVTVRTVGAPRLRRRYSALLENKERDRHESLTGFASSAAALKAARQRIDRLEQLLAPPEDRTPLAGPHFRPAGQKKP